MRAGGEAFSVRRVLALAGLLCAAAAPAACGGDPPGADPAGRDVADATGVVVRLPREVRRVVTTVPGLTQTVLALGARERLVAVSDQDAVGSKDGGAGDLAGLARIPVWPVISAERVAQAAPDLLLVDPTLSPQDLPALRRRFPVTFACDSTSLDGLERTFRALGLALSREAEAARLVDDLSDARAHARVAGSPRVLLLTWADPPMALGPGSLLDDAVRQVGALNVAHDLPGPSRPVSSEIVRERAPEWILLTGGTFPDALRTAWANVPAVKDGRIVDASGDDFVRAGPGTARALRRLAQVLSAPRADGR